MDFNDFVSLGGQLGSTSGHFVVTLRSILVYEGYLGSPSELLCGSFWNMKMTLGSLWSILESLWVDFGMTFLFFGGIRGLILGSLGALWDDFGVTSGICGLP